MNITYTLNTNVTKITIQLYWWNRVKEGREMMTKTEKSASYANVLYKNMREILK